MKRSYAVLFMLNIDYGHTTIISLNLDYRQRDLGQKKSHYYFFSGAERKRKFGLIKISAAAYRGVI